MLILPIATFFVLFTYIYDRVRSLSRAVCASFVICYAYAVITAELTSLFKAYNIYCVSALWLIALCASVVIRKRTKRASLLQLLKTVRKLSFFEVGIIAVAVIFAALLCFKAIAYAPGLPLDSANYHLPRALMYYQNRSIHSFPTKYGHMLFFGQFNAIIISQVQILCFGSNALANLVQFSGYIFALFVVYELASLIRLKRFYCIIASSLFAFLPLAALQASTTQCDILLAAFSACAVYYMLRCIKDINDTEALKPELIMAGLTLGLTALTKISGGVVVLPFLIYFIIKMIAAKKLKGVALLALVLIIALCITGGYWLRNALLLEGDFTGLVYFSLNSEVEIGLKERVQIALKNIVTTYSWLDAPHLKELANATVETYSRLVNIDVNAPGTNENEYAFSIMNLWYVPDTCPYPIQSLLGMISVGLTAIVCAVKKPRGLLLYALFSGVSLFLTACAFNWNTSAPRYLMAPFTLIMPLIAYICSEIEALVIKITQKRGVIKKSVVIFTVSALVCILSAGCFYTAVKSSFNEQVRSQLKDMTYGQRSRLVIGDVKGIYSKAVEDYIFSHNYGSVGIWFEDLDGPYCRMYPYVKAGLDVRFVFDRFMQKEEASWNYTPDCIIALIFEENAKPTVTYKDCEYVLAGGPGVENPVIEHDDFNKTYFYIRSDKLNR